MCGVCLRSVSVECVDIELVSPCSKGRLCKDGAAGGWLVGWLVGRQAGRGQHSSKGRVRREEEEEERKRAILPWTQSGKDNTLAGGG